MGNSNGQCYFDDKPSGQELVLIDITNANGTRWSLTPTDEQVPFDMKGWSNGEKQNEQTTQKIRLKDGSIYQGHMLYGKMHGFGVLVGPNKKVYEGDFLDGKKEGYGTLTFGDGRVYIGPFVNDRMHGRGKLVGSFGEMYSCTAREGRIEDHYL